MFEIPDIQLNQYGKPARIMFLAPYAPDAPDFSKKPYTGNGGYPQYHYNIYKAIQDIGYDVVSSSKPYSVQFAKGNVDYVFSLMNRFAMSRPEIFISSYCEFIQVPYLGSPPNIRAIAEDKFLTKMVFRSLELNVPEGIGLSGEKGIPAQAPFPGPYFVKKRFGAASGGIREDSICSSWKAVGSCARRLMEEGHEVLVEQYCEGIDVTVPVLGGENPVILGYVQPKSDKPGSIITEDLKLHDHLGYQLVSVQDMEQDIASDVRKIWSALGPMDYFRIDYRIDFETGERRILEMNAAENTLLRRIGLIILHELRRDSDILKRLFVVGLHEISALIAENLRLNDIYARELRINSLHHISNAPFLPLPPSNADRRGSFHSVRRIPAAYLWKSIRSCKRFLPAR